MLEVGLAVLGAALFGGGIALGWRLAVQSSIRTEKAHSEALERIIRTLEDTISKLLMARGLHPHLAAPRTFSASGIAKEDLPSEQEPIVTDSVDNAPEEDDDVEKFETDMSKWYRELDSQRSETLI